jgi:ornithine carbamoyltransferase
MADFLTMHESSHRPSDSIAYAYPGDARSNVGRSLLMMGAIMGADVRICGPRELWRPSDVQDLAGERGLRSGARLMLTDDRKHASGRRGLVYTDVWVSMGERMEAWDERARFLRPYQVNLQTLEETGNRRVKFIYRLPAFRPGRRARFRLTRPYPKRGRMSARARAVTVRASQAATITPNRNPPTWAENATPPPFALAENRP